MQLLFPGEGRRVTCYENTKQNQDMCYVFFFFSSVILIVDAYEGNVLSSIRAGHSILLYINLILQVN